MKEKQKIIPLTMQGKKIPRRLLKYYDTHAMKSSAEPNAIIISAKVGKRLKDVRIEKDWSIEELALRSRIPSLVIADAENGNPYMGGATLGVISIALKIEFHELVKEIMVFSGDGDSVSS